VANEDRIPLLDIAEAHRRAAECGVPESMSELSVFRVALHQPGVAAALYGMLVTLLQNGVLDARLRELIIMRIGWTTGSEYEWTQHWRVARLLAVPERDLLAVRDWEKADHFETAERAALATTDDVLRDGMVCDETWSACHTALGGDTAVMVELVTAIGNWQLFSTLLRSLGVPLEDGVEPWPPEGVGPT